MEKHLNQLDETIFDYLDGRLTAEERKSFEQQLSQSPALQKSVEEQRLLEGTLKSLRLQEPSTHFTQQVMQRINESPQSYSLSIKNGLFLLIGVIVVSLIAVFLVQTGMFDQTSSFTVNNETGLLSKYIKQPLPSIPVNGKWIVNSIILINLVLGFIVLDRAILRPYFERRMRHS